MRGWSVAVLAWLAAALVPATAEEFPRPGRPVTVLGGFPNGTGTDIYARLIQGPLQAALGVPVVVDNRAGAGGNLAMEAVARAEPDGHTILMATSAMLAINPHLRKLAFDTQADFAPLAGVLDAPNFLTVSAARRPNLTDCPAVMAAARAAPGRMTYASTGVGASTHLAGAQFAAARDLELVHVPYRGGPLAMTALLAGEVDIFFYQTGPVLEFWRRGEVRLLAVTSREPSQAAPGVPTVAEACGIPGFESTTWYGLAVPARTPAPVQAKLSQAVLRAAALPEVEARVREMGFTPRLEDPARMRARLAEDHVRWGEVVARTGAKAD
ncbi:tripartite tricarboxylate transporter substrate binding protein [Paracraurococcus ruber]|nr:tripartite tricarboxylate transporter substrate binding protein [Paracraurococcus ruber]